ncbi:DUF3750 domain-containing protein [Pararhizobium haloflavum]|uniref:DUF3750 domain-containing protein n=1 Tax=Pararhizobium haloflavum TaxID=2037914 RepID=UPI0035215953
MLIVFIAPALACAGWWASVDRPASWRQAVWTTSEVLPPPETVPEAAVYIMAARTGGMKGAFATHSWIVTKREGERSYQRYDKVGWGSPIRTNAYPADAFWYSNRPVVVGSTHGKAAETLIPAIEDAIDTYPHDGRDVNGYRLYPGPNSNTFVAHVLREVPELDLSLPPNAVGRDYLSGGRFLAVSDDWRDIHATLYGMLGFSAGWRSGIEVHFMGLVAGIDIRRVGIKIPAFGQFNLLPD